MLWDSGNVYIGPDFDITHIVDRVGGGDSFSGGLIGGLHRHADDHQKALEVATLMEESGAPGPRRSHALL